MTNAQDIETDLIDVLILNAMALPNHSRDTIYRGY